MCELVLELWLHKWLCKSCECLCRRYKCSKRRDFMRSRVIYCQNWYSRTANVHWCRNKRDSGRGVPLPNEVGTGGGQVSEGPWRQRRGFDLSNGLVGRLWA